MIFWLLVLVISLATVIGVAAPFLSAARREGARLGASRIGAVAVLAAAPVGALAIYFAVGAPACLSPEFHEDLRAEAAVDPAEAIAALPPEERAQMIEAMVAGLAARLEAEPDDLEGWRMLGQSYAVMGRTGESVAAYRQVIDRQDAPGAEDWRNYANALLATATPDAPFNDDLIGALTRLLALNANDPLALFYLGYAAREAGEPARALGLWRRLVDIVPADAPIMPQLEGLIAEVEAEAAG